MSEIKPADVYRAEKKILAPDTNNIILKGPPVRAGQVLVICRITVIDLTTANKTMRLGYERGGSQYWLERKPAGTSTYGITSQKKVVLADGECPIAMVESPTAADEIWFFAHGAYGIRA